MNIWEEIEQLDKQIIIDKQKLKALMLKRKDLHAGIGNTKIQKTESVPEIIAKDDFVPPTQEEMAKKWNAYNTQFPILKGKEQIHT